MSWASKIAKPYRIDHGKKFRLKDFDPADTSGVRSKQHAGELLAKGVAEMEEWQNKLYAQQQWALLLIFQAMDAAGKDSAIKHVMSGVNPQGCQVFSFKKPSEEDLNHDYLWRTTRCLPERGRIGIFNRSYYEEVLIVRVHPDVLKQEKVPATLIDKDIWETRYRDIHDFERYLSHNGLVIRKFFLNVSREEQRERFLKRLDEPQKNWKFSAADVHEREYWDDYMAAYEKMIQNTASAHAPWYVIPADHKWYTRLVVASAVVEAMEELKLSYPTVTATQRKQLDEARRALGDSKRPAGE